MFAIIAQVLISFSGRCLSADWLVRLDTRVDTELDTRLKTSQTSRLTFVDWKFAVKLANYTPVLMPARWVTHHLLEAMPITGQRRQQVASPLIKLLVSSPCKLFSVSVSIIRSVPLVSGYQTTADKMIIIISVAVAGVSVESRDWPESLLRASVHDNSCQAASQSASQHIQMHSLDHVHCRDTAGHAGWMKYYAATCRNLCGDHVVGTRLYTLAHTKYSSSQWRVWPSFRRHQVHWWLTTTNKTMVQIMMIIIKLKRR